MDERLSPLGSLIRQLLDRLSNRADLGVALLGLATGLVIGGIKPIGKLLPQEAALAGLCLFLGTKNALHAAIESRASLRQRHLDGYRNTLHHRAVRLKERFRGTTSSDLAKLERYLEDWRDGFLDDREFEKRFLETRERLHSEKERKLREEQGPS